MAEKRDSDKSVLMLVYCLAGIPVDFFLNWGYALSSAEWGSIVAGNLFFPKLLCAFFGGVLFLFKVNVLAKSLSIVAALSGLGMGLSILLGNIVGRGAIEPLLCILSAAVIGWAVFVLWCLTKH